MKDLRARLIFTVGILYLLPVRNGRVRSGWGQMRFWLPFTVLLIVQLLQTDIGCTAHSDFARNCVYSVGIYNLSDIRRYRG